MNMFVAGSTMMMYRNVSVVKVGASAVRCMTTLGWLGGRSIRQREQQGVGRHFRVFFDFKAKT